MSVAILLERISKRFTIEHDKPRSFQEMLVTAFRRSALREEFWALRDVSLSIPHGETVGIIGSNGSGKSTILKLIARTIYPTTGQVQVNGRTAALLELGAGFHPDLSGRENVLLNGLLLGMTRREIQQKLDQIVSFAELERFIDSPLMHYSSGMYMRLAFSVAVHADPEIVLIDEILAVGDEDFQQKCFDKIHALQAAGKTVLIVSHNTTTLSQLCDRLVLIHNGSIAAQGRPADVIKTYHDLLRVHDPAFRPIDGPVSASCLASKPTAASEDLSQIEMEGGAILPSSEEGARIRRVRLLDAAGQPTQEISAGDEASILVTIEFERYMHNPVFGLRVRRRLGHETVNVYTTCTAWQGMPTGTFDLGQTIDVAFRQRLHLGEGDYLFDAAVLRADEQTAFKGQVRTLTCRITGNGQTQGIADLRSAIALLESNVAPNLWANASGNHGNGSWPAKSSPVLCQTNRPLVSVLIVAYNGQDYLGRCLDSLEQSTYPFFETIVIDNASTDGSAEVASQHPLCPTVIRSKQNLGFAGGNNLGLQQAKGGIVALLNQDAHVRPDWLCCLVDGMLDDPRIGIAGCKILNPDERTIQHAGGIVHPNALTNHVGYGEEDDGQHDRVCDVDYVTGAAMAIRRDVLQKCGVLDTGYFPAYYEETDLCQRARRAGFRVVYIPKSVAVHYESTSTEKFSQNFFYFYHKNRLRFVLKNYPVGQIARGFLPFEWRWLRMHCPPDQVRPLARAYLHNAVRLPLTLISRWKVP